MGRGQTEGGKSRLQVMAIGIKLLKAFFSFGLQMSFSTWECKKGKQFQFDRYY